MILFFFFNAFILLIVLMIDTGENWWKLNEEEGHEVD